MLTVFAGLTIAPSAPHEEVIVIKPVLISKKILPLDFTITRPRMVGIDGMVMICVPSFGVLLSKVYGKVNPPSAEKRMSTLATLNGAPVVLATFHAMVAVLVPFATQLVAVFCDVTVKAVVPKTVTAVSA